MRYEAIYVRQSIDKKDSISIDTQIDLCKKEIDNLDKLKIYSDKGYSGSNINRPDFQKLLRDIKNGIISKVVIYRLDRMSRSILDFSNLSAMFEKYDVSFQSTQEKFDTNTPIGKAMLNIIMVFAQLERETIQIRITDNYYSRGEKGMRLGGVAPYGYNSGKIIIDGKSYKAFIANPVDSEVVKKIFELYGVDLMTLGEIARELTKNGVLSPNGAAWDNSKISRTIRCATYVKADINVYRYYKNKKCIMHNDASEFIGENGLIVYGKRLSNERKYTNLEDHHVSIGLHQGFIEPDLFLSCQYRLDSNSQINNKNSGKYTWMTGLIKCMSCGRSLSVVSSHNSQYLYLKCSGRALRVCEEGKNLGNVYDIEKDVEEELFSVIREYKGIEATEIKEDTKELNSIMIKIEDISNQIEKYIDSIAESSGTTIKYINEKISKLDYEKSKLEQEYNEYMLSRKTNILQTKSISDIENEWGNMTVAQKRNIASYYIDLVYVGENRDIQIRWKI